MTENDTLDLSEDGEREVQRSTSKRSGGALIGRFLAVGLFVALGTFAVIQSLAIGTPESNDEISETESDTNTMTFVQKDSSTPEPKIVEPKPIVQRSSSFGSSAANNKPSMPKIPPPVVAKGTSSGTFATTLKPATPPVITPKPPIRTVPVVAPIVRQAATPPPNRIAQLNTNSARSTFGIGGPATTPSETVGGALGAIKQKAGGVAESAADRFQASGPRHRQQGG